MKYNTFPSNYTFKNPYLQQFAEQFKPHLAPFWEGGIFSEDDASWNNVFDHCLSEALSTDILSEAINEKYSHKDKQLLDKESLVCAALLHDAYKRREIERMRSQPSDLSLLYETDTESKVWLKTLGIPDEVVELQEGVGNNAAKDIFFHKITGLEKRLLHYVDDITQGDEVVSLEERLSALEHNPKYIDQNKWSRKIFEGQTLYQVKRKINTETEIEIAEILDLRDHTHLPTWINKVIQKRYSQIN